MDNISIGVDIEEIERFNNKSLDKDKHFFDKIFTKKELDYCFSKKNYAQHLAARFCAKEAVVKALTGLGIVDVFYNEIEVTNKENGMPVASIEKYPNIQIKVSLSHNKTTAVAYVILKLI